MPSPIRSAALTVLALLAAAGGLVGWGLVGGDAAAPTPAEVTAQALEEDGLAGDVVECVLRLAERDLAVAELEPTAREELVAGCRAARDDIARAAEPDDPPVDSPAPTDQPDGYGDDPELDRLWVACEQGGGAACDELFELAPIGSAYEAFGVSCGDRPAVLDCDDLDQPAEAAPGS
jgi:hypothetical protein